MTVQPMQQNLLQLVKAYAVKTANKGIAIGEHARVGSKQDGDVVYDGHLLMF